MPRCGMYLGPQHRRQIRQPACHCPRVALLPVRMRLQRVQTQLHKSQDYATYLEAIANPVLELREKQRKWDEEHRAIEAGTSNHLGSPFGKMGAMRKLGPRPTLTF